MWFCVGKGSVFYPLECQSTAADMHQRPARRWLRILSSRQARVFEVLCTALTAISHVALMLMSTPETHWSRLRHGPMLPGHLPPTPDTTHCCLCFCLSSLICQWQPPRSSNCCTASCHQFSANACTEHSTTYALQLLAPPPFPCFVPLCHAASNLVSRTCANNAHAPQLAVDSTSTAPVTYMTRREEALRFVKQVHLSPHCSQVHLRAVEHPQ